MSMLPLAACLMVLAFATQGPPTKAQENLRNKTAFKFNFGSAIPGRDFIDVSPATTYNKELGYGFLETPNLDQHPPAKNGGALCSNKPFLFTVDLPEGNYDVRVTLGDTDRESTTTVKAEARRLMLEDMRTSPGKLVTRAFTVNVRYKELHSGETVRLKKDEQFNVDWDHQLTLEFNNTHPCVRALEISKTSDAITIYLAGDSTVTDQASEPWSAWGQMLPRFFKAGVAIANHAESGESLKSFIGEKRLEKILETIKAGDYLFIQFAHNDQKPGSSHVEPFTTYKEYLKLYIKEARTRKAIPLLVTSMHRRNFDSSGKVVNTLGDYPEAMRQVAKEESVPLIDLNAMSKDLFEVLGPAGTMKAFVHYPAGTFPGQDQELKDDTHFNAYGAYELARCVIEGIKGNKLGIAKYLVTEHRRFDPRRPDPVSTWSLPASPMSASGKSAGN
jgi:lysophospholipase L1-like esterase